MKKVMRGVCVTLLVLATAGAANAGWTDIVFEQSVSSDVVLGNAYQWGNVGWQKNVNWEHEWVIPTDASYVSVELIDADLTIQSQYTSSHTESIRADSLANPSLGDLVDGTTTFDVLPYVSSTDSDLTVHATLFDGGYALGQVILDNSTLDLVYRITQQVWEDDPIPEPSPVPAPAAIILCGLGTGLVGWLRRRGLA